MADRSRPRITDRELLSRLDEILASSEETRLLVAEMLLKHERGHRAAIDFQAELTKQQRSITDRRSRPRSARA